MDPLMGFEVRGLRVDFGTSREVTVMHPSLLKFGVVSSVVLLNRKEGCSCNGKAFSHSIT
jgi:hypothetical protein